MQTVRIYTKPACAQCDMSKRTMNAMGVDYETEDILEEMNLAAVQALGFGSAPVTIVSQGVPGDEQMWGGFQPEKIKQYITPGK